MSNENRVPPGSPEGGQFAAGQNAEATGLTLESSVFDHLDLDSIPDVDGVPFREVLERQFSDLTEYEAQHGPFVMPKELSANEAYVRAGLNTVYFGRERSTWVSESGERPYLCVETRNGADYGECDDYSSDQDCGECAHCLNKSIAQTPGFVYTENDGGEQTHYFELPEVGDDEMVPGDAKSHLTRLAQRREDIAAGKIVPWSMNPINSSHREIRDSYRGITYTNRMWGESVTRQAESVIDGATKRRDDIDKRISALTGALSSVPPVTQAPEVRTQPKTGARGQKLRTREPIPVRSLDAAIAARDERVARAASRSVIINDLERLVELPDISDETRKHLQSDLTVRRRFAESDTKEDAEAIDKLEWEVATATYRTPQVIESLARERDGYNRQIAELTEGLKRIGDENWHRWPGESYDDYRAWMDAHPLSKSND